MICTRRELLVLGVTSGECRPAAVLCLGDFGVRRAGSGVVCWSLSLVLVLAVKRDERRVGIRAERSYRAPCKGVGGV